jgi:5-methylcytosine-specific restriction endonuclease McrA
MILAVDSVSKCGISMSDESKQIRTICENCGITFFATFDRLDHTGFIHSLRGKSGEVIKDFNFCCYDCEKAFVDRLEKKHPEIKGDWTPADSEEMAKYPEYYQERTCGLCGAKKELRLSHIIPKFIVKWLKDTSASGFLRTGDTGYRIQDTFKINLLCQDCEELFSAWETYFAEQIFYPFQDGKTKLPYDDRLNKFMLSIAWRLLRVHVYELVDDPIRRGYTETALEKWKDYLLDKTKELKPYENHIFFLDNLDRQSTELPDKFLWYTLRSIDSIIATLSKDEVFTFAKIPGILLVSSINPTEFGGWKVSKLDADGMIELPQKITHEDIVQFLVSRSTMTMQIKLSKSEQDKIATAIKNKGEKILESKTLETLLAEGKRKRRKLFGQLHPVIKQLLEILDCAQTNGERPPDTRALLDFGLHLIANTLVELPKGKAKQLARETTGAIQKSKSTNTDASSISDLEEIIVIMHVCPNSSKEQLHKKIEDSFAGIQKHEYFPKATEILVLAWNPLEGNSSFELSFEIK